MVAFDLQNGAGGNIHLVQGELLGSTTLVRTSATTPLFANTHRFRASYVKFDSSESPQRILDMSRAGPISLRVSGQMGQNVKLANADIDQRFVNVAGLDHDIELDIAGMPNDEAIAYARKPYPTAAPTIFQTPDLGLDENFFESVDLTNVQLWLDATDATSLDVEDGKVVEWRDKSGKSNHVRQDTVADQPLYQEDGLHHRPAVEFVSGDYLARAAASLVGLDGMTDLDVWIVASTDGIGTINTLASVYQLTGTQRCWRLRHDVSNGNQFAAQLSQDGANPSHFAQTTAGSGTLPTDTPLLILGQYNGTTGILSLDVDGRSNKTDQQSSGPLRDTTSARLGIGCSFSSTDSATNFFEGRISFVAVKNALSSEAEKSAIRAHLRKKFGVW